MTHSHFRRTNVCSFCKKKCKSKNDYLWHCANHANEIIPGLFIGNSENASDSKLLMKIGITHILNVANDIPRPLINEHCLPFIKGYCKIGLEDNKSQNITKHFENAFQFIDDTLVSDKTSNNKLLVHCFYGVSRSVSIVIAYLISRGNFSFESAYNLVKSKRIVANPQNFISQLKEYEQSLIIKQEKNDEE